jgi:DNA-binding XRE family transcriptional regulator
MRVETFKYLQYCPIFKAPGAQPGFTWDNFFMITAHQLRAARALLNISQGQLAELAALSVPTIQRMEASDGIVRGTVESLIKLIAALDSAGIELIGEGASSHGGGRGVRLKSPPARPENDSAGVAPQAHRF